MPAEHWPEPFLPDPAPQQRSLPRPVAVALITALIIIGVLAGATAAVGGPESGRPPQPIVRQVPPSR